MQNIRRLSVVRVESRGFHHAANVLDSVDQPSDKNG